MLGSGVRSPVTDLAPPVVDPLTLRFRDPAWETAFWEDAAPERAVQGRRNARPLILVVYPAFLIFYATRDTWSHDARLTSSAAMAIGLLISIAFAIWSRTDHFRRHLDIAYGGFMACHSAVWIAAVAAAPASFVAGYGLALTVLVMFRQMQLSNFAVVPLILICLLQIVVYLALVPVSADFDASTTWGHALTLLAALVVGLPRMRDNHMVVRREYVFRRLSEGLVAATLPSPIATRLKAGERTISDRHAAVSVLFADLVGFTALTRRLDPTELAAVLDKIFTRFDDLASEEGVEKIKTIGDSYMAVAGLPELCADHAARAARMALGLRAIVVEISRATGHDLQVRIGIDTGPAVAGVLGRNKLVYDVWGDVVNTASRMESHGQPGEIQISDQFRAALGAGARVRDRGTIEIKGKGPMRTWFLDGIDPAAGGSHV